MVSKYGSLSKLLFTDTDSLCYDVKTDDLYRDFLQDLEYFDTSEYPGQQFLYSERNRKVLGKMKEETHGVPIEEFIKPRPQGLLAFQYGGGRREDPGTQQNSRDRFVHRE